MKEFRVDPEFAITDEQSLRRLFHAQTPLAIHKCQGSLDKHAQAFIRRSPFLRGNLILELETVSPLAHREYLN